MTYTGRVRMWQRHDGVWILKEEPFAGTGADLAACIAETKRRLSQIGAEWTCAADLRTFDNDGDRVTMQIHRGRNR